jgi:hypothetical protein
MRAQADQTAPDSVARTQRLRVWHPVPSFGITGGFQARAHGPVRALCPTHFFVTAGLAAFAGVFLAAPEVRLDGGISSCLKVCRRRQARERQRRECNSRPSGVSRPLLLRA